MTKILARNQPKMNSSRSSLNMLFTSTLLLTDVIAAQECQKRDYGHDGHVCVCTSNHCDTVPPPTPVALPSCLMYTSNKAGLRFQKSQGIFTQTTEIHERQIHINHSEKYQEIYGWGGAFTDSTGFNINSLNPKAQDNLLKSYFSADGIEYSLCRVPIGGTDFSVRHYSYDDGDEDVNLTKFKLASDDFKYKIPLIKKAQSLTQNKLRLFASVWTVPRWMKTNRNSDNFGFISHSMYQPWAEYFVKFLDAYKAQEIEFWGLTTHNEPLVGVILGIVNSVGWTPASMGLFVGKHLGPTIRNSNHSNIKIITLDDQAFLGPWFLDSMLENKTVRDYVDGVSIHWYSNFLTPASTIDSIHNKFPEKFILSTEACHGTFYGTKPSQWNVNLGSWFRGEAYANDIIRDVNNWISGWVDWNMVLNVTGGPSYTGGLVDSPIIVNATAGEFYKQPMFYALGHFSKFVPRGSVRIGSSSCCSDVHVAAFQRPDDATAVVILNKKNRVVSVMVSDGSTGSTKIKLSAHSITTLLYWK